MNYCRTQVPCMWFLGFTTVLLMLIYTNFEILFRLDSGEQMPNLRHLIDLPKDSLPVVIEKLKLFGYSENDILAEVQKSLDIPSQARVKESILRNGTKKSCSFKPSSDYEVTRRSIENGVKELYYFVSGALKNKADPLKTLDLVAYLKRFILNDVSRLEEVDGWRDWRIRELQELSEIVQGRIRKLQNSSDCKLAKKVACSLDKSCGFGCQVHHLVYCMITGYGTERTVVFGHSSDWRYFRTNWKNVFLPISDTCGPDEEHSMRSGKPIDIKALLRTLTNSSNFLPQAIPQDLADRLIRVHGNPFAWWVGQFLKYLLRMQPAMRAVIDDKSRLNRKFKKPIVGVHIRRTDKIEGEAQLHEVEEYMKHVEDYYEKLNMKEAVGVRHVFLASDEKKVFPEAMAKYPNYTFIFHSISSYRPKSLEGLYRIVFDVYYLSQSDYLVCTFSSNVCRLAYALMQTFHADASSRFRSLDDTYYFDGQTDSFHEVLYAHQKTREDEIELVVGDLVKVAGNHWDGFSKGTNQRTGKTGLFPSFKVHKKLKIVNFP